MLWGAIGVTAVLIVAVVIGGVWFVRERSSVGKRVDLDTWAATICAAGEKYVTSITSGADQIDPSTLELAARKDRAARLGKLQVDSARGLADSLKSVIPPEPALAYHNALIASAEDYIGAIDEQSAAIAKAAGEQQIAVANAQARFRLQANDQEVAALAVNLSSEVVTALEKQPGCGPQPVPGIRPPGGT
jgi:hypothetical protein